MSPEEQHLIVSGTPEGLQCGEGARGRDHAAHGERPGSSGSPSRSNVLPFPSDTGGENVSNREGPPPEAPPEEGGDRGAPGEMNIRLAAPLIRCLEQEHPPAVLERVARRAGVTREALLRGEGWITHARFESLLRTAREILGTDRAYQRACSYQMAKHYGPLSLVFRTVSLRKAFLIMARTTRLVSGISRFEVSPGPQRHSVRIRYESTKPESRLMCLSRQAQWQDAPTTFWRLPPAVVTEDRCIAWGDDCCEYVVRWKEPLRFRAPLSGLLLGGGASAALSASAASLPGLVALGLVTLPLLGFTAGLLWTLRRSARANRQYDDVNQRDIQVLVESHLQARRELLALHHRQQRWLELLEQQTADRTRALENVAARIEKLREQDQHALLSFSHDLKNPMAIIRGAASLLSHRLSEQVSVEKAREQLPLIEDGIVKLDALLGELMDFATSRASDREAQPIQTVETERLVDRLRRQLKALVMGRDVRVSVFQTREAPVTFESVVTVFDRILDNLLTNAAKYTERGSIVVELDGSPGQLCVKVSDTGRGMGQERLEGIFEGSVPDANPLIGESHGVGLSLVVRMLDTLGGRLEVMSRPEVGTTFWLYLPLTVTSARAHTDDESLDRIARRVVTIRPTFSQ